MSPVDEIIIDMISSACGIIIIDAQAFWGTYRFTGS